MRGFNTLNPRKPQAQAPSPAVSKEKVEAEAGALLDMIKFRERQLARELRLTAGGEEYRPLQISIAREGLNLPVDLVAQEEPAGGWESTISTNKAQLQERFEEETALYLSRAGSSQELGMRINALGSVLNRERQALQKLRGDLASDYEQTRREFGRQQQKVLGGNGGRGLREVVVGTVTGSLKLAQLFNTREMKAFKLESVDEALALLAWCSARVQAAEGNATRLRQIAAQAEQQLLDDAHARHEELVWQGRLISDVPLDTARLAQKLAGHDELDSALALRLLLDAPPDPDALAAELRDQAGRDAEKRLQRLSLEAAAQAQCELEEIDEEDPLLLLGHGVAAASSARLFAMKNSDPRQAKAEQATGEANVEPRVTLVHLTPDGHALFQDEQFGGVMKVAPAPMPGQFALLTFVEDIEPQDLAIVEKAYEAVTQAQVKENNYFLVAMVATPVTAYASPRATPGEAAAPVAHRASSGTPPTNQSVGAPPDPGVDLPNDLGEADAATDQLHVDFDAPPFVATAFSSNGSGPHSA